MLHQPFLNLSHPKTTFHLSTKNPKPNLIGTFKFTPHNPFQKRWTPRPPFFSPHRKPQKTAHVATSEPCLAGTDSDQRGPWEPRLHIRSGRRGRSLSWYLARAGGNKKLHDKGGSHPGWGGNEDSLMN